MYPYFVSKRFTNHSIIIKGALYRIQILCRRYTFWSYPAGLTIADRRDNKSCSIAESIHTTFSSLSPSLFTPHQILYSAPLRAAKRARHTLLCATIQKTGVTETLLMIIFEPKTARFTSARHVLSDVITTTGAQIQIKCFFFFLILWLFDFSAILMLLAFANSSCLI